MKHATSRKRAIKFLTVTGSVLAAAVLAIAFAIWTFLPRDQIKAALVKELSERLKHDVQIEEISVGFYPDIEFVARGMSITDRAASHQMVSAEKARIDLNLWKLLNREYVLENIVIDSPMISLVRDDDGVWNIERLMTDIRTRNVSRKTNTDVETPQNALDIGPIQIRSGTVSIHDEVSGKHLSADRITLTIDLQKDTIRIHSASLSLAPVDATISGFVSRISEPDPAIDLRAEMRVRKQGPLAGIQPVSLRPSVSIADIFIKASGPTTSLELDTSFSLNRLITAGIPAKGTLSGKLRPRQGLLEITALNASFGESVLSLSGACSNLWTEERSARLDGTTEISLQQALPLADKRRVSEFEPEGTARAKIALTATMGEGSLTTEFDLSDAGFTMPRVLRKHAGEPGSLMFAARYVPPDEIVVDTFDFTVGEGKVSGKGHIIPSVEPWLYISFDSSRFPLENLNQLPAVSFAEGTVTFAGDAWQSNPARKGLQYRSDAVIEHAALTPRGWKESLRDFNAIIGVYDQQAIVRGVSFAFGESSYSAEAEIADFGNPQVVGQLKTDMLNVNEIAGAFDRPEEGGEPEPVTAGDPGRREFSVEMAVSADQMQAGKLLTGPIATTWRSSGESHRFEPLQIKAFGGEIRGFFEIVASDGDSRWATEFSGRNLDVEKLSMQLRDGKATLIGLMSAKADLSGAVSSKRNDVFGSLNGDLRLTITDGEITKHSWLKNLFLLIQFSPPSLLVPGVREAGILNALLDAAKTGGRSLDPTCVTFSKIDGAFILTDGKAHTEDLRLESGVADLIFKGDVDLGEDQLDMQITATPLGSLGSLMGRVPIAGDKLKKAKEAALSMSFVARGPIADPEVSLAVVDRIMPNKEQQ